MSSEAILDGRVAIITGAGRGIGAAVARLFAEQGAKVVLNDLGANPDGTGSDEGPAHAVAEEIVAAGGKAIANGGDIADTATGEELVKLAVERFGGLDVVVNVAGILRDKMIFNLGPADWDAVIRVHLRGTYSTVKPASAYWRQQRNPGGQYRIINFASNSGLNGAAGQPNYAAAKMGIVGFTYSLAQALGRYGVTANAVSPSAMTRLVAAVVDPSHEAMAELLPENIAPVVAYLASKESGWLSGRVIGAAGRTLSLYNNPSVISTVESPGSWDLDWLAENVEAAFRPLADGVPQIRYAG
ncbi:SDR family NAD(P)-dependent oxidoreductase [Sphaerisporangium viridialbum]|uniref:SDR family NAD(P)-dependent oxidoreductase n=1 Tax=Sphaerisporangium viridialbum TaxID=46189 RepID=UPI003C768A3D